MFLAIAISAAGGAALVGVGIVLGRAYERMVVKHQELEGKVKDTCHVCHKPYSMPLTMSVDILEVEFGPSRLHGVSC